MSDYYKKKYDLLIVPFGIETYSEETPEAAGAGLLIVPFGIETPIKRLDITAIANF